MNRQELPKKRQRFFQFDLRQLLVLFIVIALLFGLLAPKLWKAFDDRKFQSDLRKQKELRANLDAAVRAGDATLTQRALECGADPNFTLTGKNDLLSTSIENGRVDIMEMLLDYGFDLEKHSALRIAIDCGQPVDLRVRMIRRLLQDGADPYREKDGNAMDAAVRSNDAAVGDVLREFGMEYGPREMAAFNRLEELRCVVDEDPGIVRQRFEPVYASRPGHGPTLLGLALWGGYRDMAIYLIDRGAPLDVIEGLGYTLLHKAARGGDPELIRLLVARGLDVNARDDYGETPLKDCASCTRPEAIDALIEAGADVDAQGINQDTALHSAARCGRSEVVSRLLAVGASPTIANIHGETALDTARKGLETLLELKGRSPLLAKNEKDLESQTREFREIQKLLDDASR